MSVYYNFETSGMGSFTIFDIKEKGTDISFTESIKLTGYTESSSAVKALYVKLSDGKPMVVNVNDDVLDGRKELKLKPGPAALPENVLSSLNNKIEGFILCPERKEYFEIGKGICPYLILAGNPKTVANDFKGRNIPLKEGFSELSGKWTDLESQFSNKRPENYKNITENVKYSL
jgi:hypothetical protein